MLIQETLDRPEAMLRTLRRKLDCVFDFSDATARDILALCSEAHEFAPRESLCRAEQPYPGIYLIENGWALRARFLEDGSRQIVNVAMPGDFLGINAILFERSDFDVTAQTAVTAYYIDPRRLRDVFGRDPVLAAAAFWVSAQEESVLSERIVSLGRRSARQRMAHVLCELLCRAEIAHGPVDSPDISGTGSALAMIPLTQEDFADILGLSLVHTNKTLRRLDRDGVLSFRKGLLVVRDRAALEQAAGFDRGYLHFTRAAATNRRRAS